MSTPTDLQYARGLVEQSLVFLQQQQVEQALQYLNDALQVVPNLPSALVKRASVLQAVGRHREALADFNICLALSPKLSHLKSQRDLSLQAALIEIDAQLTSSQKPASAWLDRAMLLMQAQHDDAALASFQQVLAIDAAHVDALINMGNLLLRLNRREESLSCYQRLLEIDPGNVIALFNRGNLLQQDARYREALACYDAALQAKQDLPEALMEKAHCQLALGEWLQGWPLFESRWDTEQLRNAKLQTVAPMWRGESLGESQTLLLWAEQGLGDSLQFVRFLPMVAQRAQSIVLRVPASLKALLSHVATRIDSIIVVIENSEQLPAHFAQCPLMSLPLVFAMKLDGLKVQIPYLSAPLTNSEKWKTALGSKRKPRIGIVWAGGQRLLNNPTRDMPLESLMPLFAVDAQWIGLQQSMPDTDATLTQQIPQLSNVGDQLSDFADTAGLLEQLDLLISIDSSVAHLAGALGKPVWLLLRKSGEWRWMHDRDDTPWYPQHRLFRQQRHGDWDEPIQRIANALPAFVAGIP
jgi:tetratricopeptide (TPR) repeat protein